MLRSLIAVVLAAVGTTVVAPIAAAACPSDAGAWITGGGEQVDLGARQATGCESSDGQGEPNAQQVAQPYDTFQVACSINPQENARGDCRGIDCPPGQAWAYRVRHYPDGREEYRRGSCIPIEQIQAQGGATVAEILEAVRQVRLPGGRIGIAPARRGLVNLPSYFWLEDAVQPPVDLQVDAVRVHARFAPVAYRWSFGDGQTLTTTSPGTPGVGGPVRTVYAGKGTYTVTVRTVWMAEAWTGGELVGRLDNLASDASTVYRVREVKTRISD